MPMDLAAQLELALRLILAAVLGAVVGLEREIHDHPAGMRTHLLVSVGAAAFTVLSIYAFGEGDPARVAAQIVSGIGFLGAGAILKEGANVRGLTTAASMWAVAAVGMAAGAGAYGVALAITLIVMVSLWPLRIVSERFVGRDRYRLRVELVLADAARLVDVAAAITEHQGTILHLASRPGRHGGLQVDLEVRAPDAATGATLAATLAAVDGIELEESTASGD
jgi:putative Mg2+ transporter-C (MgtC) family protein